MNENTRKKALLVQDMLEKHYEPERQDRCKLWVYRNHVRRVIPMSERTFWRYCERASTSSATATGSATATSSVTEEEDVRQLKLFE